MKLGSIGDDVSQRPVHRPPDAQSCWSSVSSRTRILHLRVDSETPRKHQVEYERAISQWEQVLAWSNRHHDRDTAAAAHLALYEEIA